MPEGRDRRATPVDVAANFARRRASIFHDDSYPVIFGSGTGPVPTRVRFGTPRNRIRRGRARFVHLSPGVGSENTPPFGSSSRRRRATGSTRRSVLPSWYPRTPLRDITAVVRAIERRRARFGETEGQQTANPFPADQLLFDPSPSASVANLEHGYSVPSPKKVSIKLQTPAGSKVPKILLDITNTSEDSELTPQKKLLNSIDKVEKEVREELQKLKRTPSAKKAEREKRVKTLKSMR